MGKWIRVSYAKFLMENKLNRYYTNTETTDHINGDFNDNRLENLRVIERSQHVKEDVKRLKSQEFECPQCGTDFTLVGRRLSYTIQHRKRGHLGPFCSKSCSGSYIWKIKKDKVKLEVKQITPEYTTLKEMMGIKKKKS